MDFLIRGSQRPCLLAQDRRAPDWLIGRCNLRRRHVRTWASPRSSTNNAPPTKARPLAVLPGMSTDSEGSHSSAKDPIRLLDCTKPTQVPARCFGPPRRSPPRPSSSRKGRKQPRRAAGSPATSAGKTARDLLDARRAFPGLALSDTRQTRGAKSCPLCGSRQGPCRGHSRQRWVEMRRRRLLAESLGHGALEDFFLRLYAGPALEDMHG